MSAHASSESGSKWHEGKTPHPELREARVTLDVSFPDVTIPQAAALRALFEQMRILGGMGGSRWVCFYSDGDGNFRPKPVYVVSEHADVVKEWSEGAGSWDHPDYQGEYRVDFDSIAWPLTHPLTEDESDG